MGNSKSKFDFNRDFVFFGIWFEVMKIWFYFSKIRFELLNDFILQSLQIANL